MKTIKMHQTIDLSKRKSLIGFQESAGRKSDQEIQVRNHFNSEKEKKFLINIRSKSESSLHKIGPKIRLLTIQQKNLFERPKQETNTISQSIEKHEVALDSNGRLGDVDTETLEMLEASEKRHNQHSVDSSNSLRKPRKSIVLISPGKKPSHARPNSTRHTAANGISYEPKQPKPPFSSGLQSNKNDLDEEESKIINKLIATRDYSRLANFKLTSPIHYDITSNVEVDGPLNNKQQSQEAIGVRASGSKSILMSRSSLQNNLIVEKHLPTSKGIGDLFKNRVKDSDSRRVRFAHNIVLIRYEV